MQNLKDIRKVKKLTLLKDLHKTKKVIKINFCEPISLIYYETFKYVLFQSCMIFGITPSFKSDNYAF